MAGEYYLALTLAQLGIVFLLYKLAITMDIEHYPLKLFFLWLMFIIMVPMTNTMMEMVSAVGLSADLQTMAQTFYYVVMFVTVVVTFYLGIYVLKNSLIQLGSTMSKDSPKVRRSL